MESIKIKHQQTDNMEKVRLERITDDELLDLKKALEKKKDSEDFYGILSVLKVLTHKQITLEHLQNTKIGKTISSLTKIEVKGKDSDNEAQNIRQQAESLIERWRKVSKMEKNKKIEQKPESKPEPKPAQAQGIVTDSNHSSAGNGSARQGLFIPLGLKIHTGTGYRDAMIKKFIELMQVPPDEDNYNEDQLDCAAHLGNNIEKELFNKFPNIKEYQDKARSLVFNLKDSRNPELRVSLMQGILNPTQLVTMDPKEMASSQLKEQRDKIIKDNLNSRRTDWHLENAAAKGNVGFFTCRKCKSKNTTYFQMQTRGADEPMTNFVTCLDCKNQFKC
ncbi:transcription elongation factor a 1 [Stylonychia lemnae]|uniref:Transcription elongation factor a 1 n=1 Tax=Stylonychia lemnae TaxID=5949 RepID=A0A078A3R4_STYLE|nr:transcription elongation factor a 1 [Stylonychia lemnae]|eukprot:CDW76467.1 transcription elongation factor a 1 [Stylonychia lemnae]